MIVFTRMTRRDTDGCPQADSLGERESSEFKRILNGGSQADGGQVLINDYVLVITDIDYDFHEQIQYSGL